MDKMSLIEYVLSLTQIELDLLSFLSYNRFERSLFSLFYSV